MLNILEDLKKNKLQKVAGDASFRNFYRVNIKNKKYILIHCKKEKKINLERYAAINSFLIKNKLLAPKLIQLDLKSNCMLIEDFGDVTYKNILDKKTNQLKYYKKIVDVLLQMQLIQINLKSKKVIKNTYAKTILMKESDLFFKWYAPKKIAKSKIKKFIQESKKELSSIFHRIQGANKFFVHRDFHVSNLMSYKKKVGIIDSQDAMIGNVAYDILSLIDDVRIKTSTKLKKQILHYYISSAKKVLSISPKVFQDDFDILSVQRNLKIIGIFTRLHVRDGKKQYLSLISYAWSLMHLRLQNPIFGEFNKILNYYLSKKRRK